MNDPFYATIKMTSGEEVLSEVMYNEEEGQKFLLLHNPIVMEEGYSFEEGVPKMSARKWLRFSQDDMVIVNMKDVITISELDKYGTSHYQKYLVIAKVKSPVRREMKAIEHTGYLGTIEEKRQALEDLFDKS